MTKNSPTLSKFNTNYINPTTLAKYASSLDTWREILSFHSSLSTDDFVYAVDQFYRAAIKKYGDFWWHLDIVNILYAAAKLENPKNYLEIGVRRGRSCAVVAHGSPNVNIFACDMWVENYAGMENPGENFVKNELAQAGHIGRLTFLNGSSHLLIPKFFDENPDLLFNLITVDGDHSEDGAYADLSNVIQRLAPGGILVFDDIAHPSHPYLIDCWRRATAKHPNLLTYEYVETGYGIAFAVNQV